VRRWLSDLIALPRVQTRSSVTVASLLEATLQVLLHSGPERLTTTRVAERSGRSVGTLHQYFPNKQSLLFALLENHLGGVLGAVERACRDSREQPLDNMVEAVVGAFIDAKLNRADVSKHYTKWLPSWKAALSSPGWERVRGTK
jgi:AcrR family transcriptional regulator